MGNLPPPKSKINSAWRILIIDDDEDDFFLLREMLKEARGRKYDVHWANTFESGQKELLFDHYHAVLVDYDLGYRSGVELIREANERGYAAPLILFTGRGNYEVDVEAMEAGATLYLSKGEVNSLLLERSIRYAIELKQKEHSLRVSEVHLREREAALQISEERFQKAFDASPNAQVISRQEDGRILLVNDGFERLFGYLRDEVLEKTSLELNMFLNPSDRDEAIRSLRAVRFVRDFELDIRTKSGEIRHASLSIEFINIGNENLMLTIIQDITERKQAEAMLRETATLLKERNEALLANEAIILLC